MLSQPSMPFSPLLGHLGDQGSMSIKVGGDVVTFIEASSFRHLPLPPDFDSSFVVIGSVVSIAGAWWRVVGRAANPHRSIESLVFVELAPDRRVGSGAGQNRGRRATDRL